ncbi:ATP-dependent zinc metalloprotease FtsH [Corynebacterium incognita]|uniref:ATP-dependent zinc metalloprotease FtsH n=1 Tax=Corynebacterium incognita TaxID=2754725 RepID=A0A7G7CRF6_9CORY|nr:ATP-dependent zinc metalloprotease FtsH [Corynebacterium incognita]QNE90172.1 ATP-dependent zinc metalloprotease FtsH [Corynebacterium incognita]
MNNKKILQWGGAAAVVLVTLFAITFLLDDTRGMMRVDTSVAMEQLSKKNIKEAQIDDREQQVRLKLKEPITVEERDGIEEVIAQYPARTSPEIFDAVKKSKPEKYTTHVSQDSFLGSMLSFMLPMLIMFGLLFWLMSRMQTGGMFGFGGNKAKELTKDMPTNTFADVAGADEAVDELQEIKDFLEDPTRYHELGAKIPRGVLLYGPPGTGKTLLARAVAGEAGVPFFSISGSDFVEMFVGVGASRVRDLFKQAKENSPCIIFVDEIDAVGRQRGSGMGGGHDEREQTLNQLLVEMDGFGDREGVILMAATNRPDILDPALLRPGRFDRQIPVTNPDLKGREQILKVHAKGKPLGPDADLSMLAKRTAGMSGADLANVLNEAALLTARIGGTVITADALEEATDRVIGGPRRSSKLISELEKKITAYHEGGHTLAAWAQKHIERVYKVTILARGRTGGHAMTAQEDDKGMYTRDEMYAQLVFAMGGRAAEELVFGSPTTGASSDIEQATKIARAMLTEYGFSPELGTVKYGKEQGDPFAGYGGGGGSIEYSDKVAATIDEQMAYLLDRAHEQAYKILESHRDYLDTLAEQLLEKETLRRPDLEVIFEGIDPAEPDDVFPNENVRFPKQAGREPIKTPTELAIERGEEPPKRRTLLDASKEARERRLAEKALEQDKLDTDSKESKQPGQPSQPSQREEHGFSLEKHAGDNVSPWDAPRPSEDDTAQIPRVRESGGRHAQPAPQQPAPDNWNGKQELNNPYAPKPDKAPEQPAQPQQPEQGDDGGQHPGWKNYGDNE